MPARFPLRDALPRKVIDQASSLAGVRRVPGGRARGSSLTTVRRCYVSCGSTGSPGDCSLGLVLLLSSPSLQPPTLA